MSDVPQGPGWWQASDGKWYPPEQFPGGQPPAPPAPGQPPTYQAYPTYQTYQPGYAAPRNEPLAVWSLVLSIVGVPLGCCWIGVVGSVLGVVFGFVARKRIAGSNGMLTGDGLALAGIVIGFVGGALVLLLIVLSIVGNASVYWNT